QRGVARAGGHQRGDRRRLHPLADAARAASAVMRGQSRPAIASAGVSQEPPTANTLGSARYWAMFSWVTPPVGQKRNSGNGPAIALSIGTPPATEAGNSFSAR